MEIRGGIFVLVLTAGPTLLLPRERALPAVYWLVIDEEERAFSVRSCNRTRPGGDQALEQPLSSLHYLTIVFMFLAQATALRLRSIERTDSPDHFINNIIRKILHWKQASLFDSVPLATVEPFSFYLAFVIRQRDLKYSNSTRTISKR